nr:MAG TPA: hypothetical protein [Caudoviricetes sp.]
MERGLPGGRGCTGDEQASGRCGNALSGRSEK